MVSSSIFVLAFAFLLPSSTARPLQKRIAQTIADSTAKWEQACLAAGGADQCNPLSITAFSTLLAAAGSCDQQNAGDQMIDLAKSLNNDADMIKFTQIFVQQPRNSPDSFSIPYCQQAPQNEELNGLYQCQFEGVQSEFVGNLQPGDNGTIPFGLSSPVNPAGSCPAHTSGGIPDGTQLVDITEDPGLNNVGSGSGDNTSSAVASATATGTSSGDDSATTTASDVESATATTTDAESTTATATATSTSAIETDSTPACSVVPSATTASTSASATSSSTSSFALQNGLDAQKLNAEFATLNENDTCTDNACVGSSFALCSNGKFVLMDCGTDLICAALPLVNSAGTSIACTTQEDALSRIAATGATGGLTGSN